jgi:two-component system sensor histidine kinase BaeS
MGLMRTLFSRILLAQVVAVVLALFVVTVITRASLNKEFKEFLAKQETAVLQSLAPALSDYYKAEGSWRFLHDNPRAWQRIWRISHPLSPGTRRDGPGHPRGRRGNDGAAAQGLPVEPRILRWMMAPERGTLRDRLFLLDEGRSPIAGAETTQEDGVVLEAIELDGRIVGWLGFAPMGNELPPDARRFLDGQIRITVIALAFGLIAAAALAFLLARNMSRPVRQLAETVGELSRGEYRARAPINTLGEIGSLATHVNQLAESLEKSRSARRRWMADIAHELRTPVSILKGEIEALADGVRKADEQTSASLHEEVNQLSALIDDLQTLALSDAGALNIRKIPVDLAGLVGQCIEAFRKRLAARGVTAELHADDGITLTADQQRLRQMLHNLLENSSRYVSEGGRVLVSLSSEPGRAVLVLEESGPGLTDDQLEQLFERFYRVEGSRARSSGGSGLGLSICKNIVEAHGGSIGAEHSELGGLKLWIVLPC